MSEERAVYKTNADADKWRPDPNTLKPFSDSDYQVPDKEHVRALLRACDLTGVRAAALVGVDGRTIRRYTGGERNLPYAMWRVLLVYGGFVEPERQDAALLAADR